jgi:hypothetical protein
MDELHNATGLVCLLVVAVAYLAVRLLLHWAKKLPPGKWPHPPN